MQSCSNGFDESVLMDYYSKKFPKYFAGEIIIDGGIDSTINTHFLIHSLSNPIISRSFSVFDKMSKLEAQFLVRFLEMLLIGYYVCYTNEFVSKNKLKISYVSILYFYMCKRFGLLRSDTAVSLFLLMNCSKKMGLTFNLQLFYFLSSQMKKPKWSWFLSPTSFSFFELTKLSVHKRLFLIMQKKTLNSIKKDRFKKKWNKELETKIINNEGNILLDHKNIFCKYLKRDLLKMSHFIYLSKEIISELGDTNPGAE